MNRNIIGTASVQVLAVEMACCSFRVDIPSALQSTVQKQMLQKNNLAQKQTVLHGLCLENY